MKEQKGKNIRRKPLEFCSYVTECQGDTKRVITLNIKLEIFRGFEILKINNKIQRFNRIYND